MRLAFICQRVDRDDPVHATTCLWIDTLAASVEIEKVLVIAQGRGNWEPPQAVDDVRVIGGGWKVGRGLRFVNAVAASLMAGMDAFFIHQGGPYPALLLPIRIVGRKPIYQWKAHSTITPTMRWYARWCDTLLFTSTRGGFPLELPNVRVVGQGIDSRLFRRSDVQPSRELVTVGRVSAVKRIECAIEALAIITNSCTGKRYTLDVIGPVLEGDEPYRHRLDQLVRERGLTSQVRFTGPVLQRELPEILSRYRAYLNFSVGAMDKAVVEAMAVGLPVISSNRCVREIVPVDLCGRLCVPEDDHHHHAAAIQAVLSLPSEERVAMGARLRAVAEHHDSRNLVARIVSEIA